MDTCLDIPRGWFNPQQPGITAVLTLTALTLFWASPVRAAGPTDAVARVNGTTLYQYDLSHAMEASQAWEVSSNHHGIGGLRAGREHMDSRKTLESLIDIELLYQESLRHRYHGLVEEAQERYQQVVRRMGGKDRFISALQCNNITPEQFRKTIFRNLSIKCLLDEEVYSRIKIGDEKAREYYEENKDSFRAPKEVRIRQILVKASSDPGNDKWGDAKKKALTIYKDASSGEDFIMLARRHSDDPVSANTGGDMGVIQEGNIHDVFGSLIFNMNVGSVTRPIRTPQGFYIIKIVSSTPQKTRSFKEVRDYIITKLRRKQARKMITDLIVVLRNQADIEILTDK